jgi:hypothetical protein
LLAAFPLLLLLAAPMQRLRLRTSVTLLAAAALASAWFGAYAIAVWPYAI